ncbi:hypothetical protein LOS73_04890 [Pseudoalteromonas sp. SCSIO 43210]
MVKDKKELFKAINDESILINPELIWSGELIQDTCHTCENPEFLFNIFLTTPEMFPKPEQLLILWSTNSNSIVAFLREDKVYIKYYLEDGPSEYEVLGKTYQQMISNLFASLIFREVREKDLKVLANTFNFKYLDELASFISRNDDWEDNTSKFISEIE